MKRLNLILSFFAHCAALCRGVSIMFLVKGNDNNAGTVEAPFKDNQ